MAQPPQIVSTDYPFLRLHFDVRGRLSAEAPALLDTGFTGDLALPTRLLSGNIGLPDTRVGWELGDGSIASAPIYLGTIELIGLPPFTAAVTFIGDEYILGRGVLDRFSVTFDHGQRVVLEL
jgi:predicted aspartyl protease